MVRVYWPPACSVGIGQRKPRTLSSAWTIPEATESPFGGDPAEDKSGHKEQPGSRRASSPRMSSLT